MVTIRKDDEDHLQDIEGDGDESASALCLKKGLKMGNFRVSCVARTGVTSSDTPQASM